MAKHRKPADMNAEAFATWFGNIYEPRIMALGAVLELETVDRMDHVLAIHRLTVRTAKKPDTGTQILDWLCSEANQAGIMMVTKPAALQAFMDKPGDQASLEAFCGGFGFTSDPETKQLQRYPYAEHVTPAPKPAAASPRS